MVGRNPGWVTSQGEVLADLFARDGWTTRETSTHLSRPVRLLDTVWCLFRWRRSIDVVVLSVFSGPAFVMADLSSLVARRLGLPVIIVLRGGNLPKFRTRFPTWVHRVLDRAALVVAPSPYLVPVSDVEPRRVTVIQNVVDTSVLRARVRSGVAPRLLWMRTFHAVYNPCLALLAFERVLRDHPDTTLTMAGQDKGLLEAVQARVAEHGWNALVKFPGFLSAEEKRAAFNSHDIYVHTNNIDNAPVSVLEAAAAGLPIVATRAGGIPFLLDHEETALLVPDGDADAMASAIKRLLDDPELAQRLSTNGRALAERSSWPAVRAQWVSAFDRVLGHA